jgi:acyl-CoA thioesterase FadM
MARRFSQGVDVRALAALRKVGRVEARAEQALVDADGELVAHCTIRGVWTSPGGRLCRIPSVAKASVNHDPFDFPPGDGRPGDMASLFSPPAPRRPGTLDLPPCPPEIKTEHARTMTVRSSDCDVFRHVNASNYLRYVADSLASQGASPSIHRARLHYLVQAKAHDTVTVGLQHLEDSTWFAELCRDDEVLFRAVVETEDTLAQ